METKINFWITFLIFITAKLWEISCITNRKEQRNFRRHIDHRPGPVTVITDWEVGLREAANQALLREHYQDINLRHNLFEAPLIGKEDNSSPFGDIAVIARGQLYATHEGYIFVQDSYQNDCDDCHNIRTRCDTSSCEVWKPHGQEELIALWTVKRVRHRDTNQNHRYEVEYTISPISPEIRAGFIKRHRRFDYNVPGHIFVIKTDYSGERHKENHSKPDYSSGSVEIHHLNRPGILIGITPEGHKHVLHSYPGYYTSYPPHSQEIYPPPHPGGPPLPPPPGIPHLPPPPGVPHLPPPPGVPHLPPPLGVPQLPPPPGIPNLPPPHHYPPPQYYPRPTTQSTTTVDSKEIELYKELLESLAQKTSTTHQQTTTHRTKPTQPFLAPEPETTRMRITSPPTTQSTSKATTTRLTSHQPQTTTSFVPSKVTFKPQTTHYVPPPTAIHTSTFVASEPTIFETHPQSFVPSTMYVPPSKPHTTVSHSTAFVPVTKPHTTTTTTTFVPVTKPHTTTTFVPVTKPHTTTTTTTYVPVSKPHSTTFLPATQPHSTTYITVSKPQTTATKPHKTTYLPATKPHTTTTYVTISKPHTTETLETTKPQTTYLTQKPTTLTTQPETTLIQLTTGEVIQLTSTTQQQQPQPESIQTFVPFTTYPITIPTQSTQGLKETTQPNIYYEKEPPVPPTETIQTTQKEPITTIHYFTPSVQDIEEIKTTQSTKKPTTTKRKKYKPMKITIQQGSQESGESDVDVFPESLPTVPMQPETEKPVEKPYPDSINEQLPAPEKNTDTTIPFVASTVTIKPTIQTTNEIVESTTVSKRPIPEATAVTNGHTIMYFTDLTTVKETSKEPETTITMTKVPLTEIDFSTTTLNESTTPQYIVTHIDADGTVTQTSTPLTTTKTTPSITIKTTKKPNKVEPPDYYDELFGNPKPTQKISTTPKPTKLPQSEIALELFGGSRRSKYLRYKGPKRTTEPKIIYSNFFEASTLPSPTTPMTPQYDYRPKTSQSYSTSISFEVNPKKVHHTTPTTIFLDNDVEYEPMVMAKISEVMHHNGNFTVYKAEFPNQTEGKHKEKETKKVFDNLALQLVNHARSIDLLTSTKAPRQKIATKYKRRNYTTKKRKSRRQQRKL